MSDRRRRRDLLAPPDYSARVAYRRPHAAYAKVSRVLGTVLTSVGLAPRDAVTLIVRGRVSGQPRSIPILRTRHDGADYLVSLAGESEWARNVRAAHGEAAIRRRGTRPAVLVELPAAERAEVLAAYLRAGRARSGPAAYAKQLTYYFGLDHEPTLAELAAIAEYYPVFRIDYA